MLHAAGHAHQARHIERHECEVEADEPAPERGFAPAVIELEAERLGEPIGVAGKGAEQDAGDDDVMEMGDQEHAVVHLPVDRRQSEQHTGQPAEDEGDHEADGPENRHRELDAPAIHREQPVEDLTPVGTAMIMLVMPKKALTLALAPMVKKWCSQTVKDRMQIARVAATIDR